MIANRLAVPLTVAVFLLFGCQQAPESAATATAVETAVAPDSTATTAAATITPEPTAPARPTITPEPTAIVDALAAGPQVLGEDGELTIESVTSSGPGWVVIYADDDGSPGSILGFEAVSPAVSEPVMVTIDPWSATAALYARLHVDAGDGGEFEYPGSDIPVEVGGEEVIERFTVELDLPIPEIEVADQVITRDGLVSVKNVFALGPSWLVIHADNNGEIGPVIGQHPLDEGQNSDLEFPIRWREATDTLTAMLYEDADRPGGFDPSMDLLALVGGEPIVANFKAQLPPDIFAYDQPVVDGKLVLERVVSERPGWIVVYTDNEGQPDTIIGFEPVETGVNEFIEVEIVETAVTPQVYLVLHEESENAAEFNFPAGDNPAAYDGEIVPPVMLLTNPGNYLITKDQALSEDGEITVPIVVTDLNTWLVIYTEDDNGQPDEIIGRLWLPAGVNRDNKVSIPANRAGERLLAALHQDAGTERVFDFPDGDDSPLQRNRQIILAPFMVEPFPGPEAVSP